MPGGGLDAGEATGDVRALLDRYNVANPRNLLLVWPSAAPATAPDRR